MKRLKRIMAINDISCYGKCALTITLPIVSAAGIECSVIPSVILSTHLGYPGGTFYDMTSQFVPIMDHLSELDIKFDAILTGFLGSSEQIVLSEKFIDTFKEENTLVIVDPTMADNGEMYGLDIFDQQFCKDMGDLFRKADIVVPNITEAVYVLGEEYKAPPYDKDYIEELLLKLNAMGPKEVVITGIHLEDKGIEKVGCATYNESTGEFNYFFSEEIGGYFIGTGDIFASVITSGRILGFTIEESAKIAVEYIHDSIVHTSKITSDNSKGINFEQTIPELLKRFEII